MSSTYALSNYDWREDIRDAAEKQWIIHNEEFADDPEHCPCVDCTAKAEATQIAWLPVIDDTEIPF